MASYGCSWFPLASFSTLQTLKNPLGKPNPAGTSYPKATSMASFGRSCLPLARPYTLKTLTALKNILGMPYPAGNRHPPRPHQSILIGVQACLLPYFPPLTRLKTVLARPTPQAQATPRPHQWLLLGVHACLLPGVKQLKKTLTTLKNLLGMPSPAGNRHPPRPDQWLLMGVQPFR